MHYLMLVTLEMQDDATSLCARMKARDLLLKDDSFCGQGGRFGSPMCDWFVIGGRWSGILQETLLGDAYQAALRQEFPEIAAGSYSSDLAEKHRDRLNQLWQRFGGTGANPHTRSAIDELGGDDDAMRIDQALYDHFLAEYRGEACHWHRGDDSTFVDLEDSEVDETFIDRKWLVVVDYHN
jgi:hypothetical protein